MKALLPLIAAAGLLAACDSSDCNGRYCDHQHHHHGRAPMHGSSDDALSDRSLGSSRGSHNEKRYGDYNTKDNWHNKAYVVSPADPAVPNYRPDGTYYVPAYEARGYQQSPSSDALSDRSLGSSRGAHNEPMTHKDMNHDGQYDYTPYYAPRSTSWRYDHN